MPGRWLRGRWQRTFRLVIDPFADIADEAPEDGPAMRSRLLADAKRGFAPIRKVFVQRPNTERVRRSLLADLVTGRQERPLDAFLLLHAIEPVLDGSPLPLSSWAKMLSRRSTPCTSNTASRALDVLAEMNLVLREQVGRRVVITPLLEDGSGNRWVRPGRDAASVGPGYFTIPYDYWTSDLVDQLTLPGKAMLLILLAETSQKPSFAMAIERAQEWYGISERTAERGFQQLGHAGLLLLRRQVVADPRSPTGLRAKWHRALSDPYSTDARARIQEATAHATRKRASLTNKAAAKQAEPPKELVRKKRAMKTVAVVGASPESSLGRPPTVAKTKIRPHGRSTTAIDAPASAATKVSR
jgi:hypothetical protein